MQQQVAVTKQSDTQRPRVRGRPWAPGQSGNPSGSRVNTRASVLFDEIAAELGGAEALSAIDRTLLLQAARLLMRSQRIKEPDAAIRMSSEARRTLEGLRRRCVPAVRSAPAEPFGAIAVSAQAEAAARRAAELAADASEALDGSGETDGASGCRTPADDKTLTSDRPKGRQRSSDGDGEAA
jgi:hypothetical protein